MLVSSLLCLLRSKRFLGDFTVGGLVLNPNTHELVMIPFFLPSPPLLLFPLAPFRPQRKIGVLAQKPHRNTCYTSHSLFFLWLHYLILSKVCTGGNCLRPASRSARHIGRRLAAEDTISGSSRCEFWWHLALKLSIYFLTLSPCNRFLPIHVLFLSKCICYWLYPVIVNYPSSFTQSGLSH